MTLKKIFISTLIFFIACPMTHAKADNNLLHKVQKRYQNKNFKMDFLQESTLKALDIRQTAGGFVIFSHPSKMDWEYNFPNTQKIITNGKKVWIYTQKNNQVMTGRSSDYFQEGSGGAFLTDISNIDKFYKIKEVKSKSLLTLIPKKESPQVEEVELQISDEDGKIKYVKTKNKNGDETKIYFRNEVFLDSTNEEDFNFVPPPNASITKISE